MSIAHISDGESGLSVRGKLNEVIDFTPVLDTAANFTANNPILNLGQLGIESDTLLSSSIAFKIGDGVHQWSVLPYANVSLSGLTTNKVLKAGNATTAVDSNITDDGTTVTVNSEFYVYNGAGKADIFAAGTTAYISADESASKIIESNNAFNNIKHATKNTFDAPLHEFNNSMTKNGVEVATENYVDNLITGLNWKKSVLYSTNSGEDLSLTGLTAAIDGSLRFLSPTDRILVKNQSTQSLNGIYNPSSGAWTRVVDADSDSEILAATVYVREGSVEKDRVYAVNVSPITLGTTAITFALISGAGAYTYGSYLKLTGNVFDIDFTTFSTNQISEGSKLFFTDARVLTAPLTGFASAAGTITAADTILSAINKLNGNLDSKTLFKSTTDSSTHTGTLTNTIIWSEDISNKLSSGDIAEIISDVVRVSGASSANIKYYLNSSNSLSGATQIGQYFYGFSGLNIADFRRQLIVKSNTSIRVKGTISSMLNDLSIFGNYADVTVNLASLYVIFAITLGNTGDQFLVSSRKMVR